MIEAKKSFGQNFLINKKIQNAIVEAADIIEKDVIEIGPGQGALTDILVQKVKSLVAYELDPRLYEYLKTKNYLANIKILNQDFLTANFSDNYTDQISIIGNIPYNITSPILFKILDNYLMIDSATLMVQKEVAQRLVATPSSKIYGKLSITFQIFGNIKKIIDVNAAQFIPAPKVDSAVVKIDFIHNNDYINENKDKIIEFVALCFQFKRKTLVNNLLGRYSKEKITSSFSKLNLKLNIRAENLSRKNILDLFAILENKKMPV
ncbi:16S rRNA (adenine(1518)-N(6)/adenine(1519)-N(6))-dimethyltransferase RsmA [Mycoplasma phocoeninasale]|nr:16S rRNA (adenine(1518)-N(6)/adenine(1519)-N(6))-dimethyltransferase RsmA [Mycoplasma phocoeninasale]MBN0970572.1 ribosomal RNA small subunit methyltransferase A [Mycoplasma phocoeninasale]